MVPSFPTNLGMIVNMADEFCTRLSQNHEDLCLLSPSESGAKFEKKNRGGGLEAETSGERCIQLRICPCESSSLSVQGAVLKYGFKHEMIQFTCSKIGWFGRLPLGVFINL